MGSLAILISHPDPRREIQLPFFMTTALTGASFIGQARSASTTLYTHGIQPGTGIQLEPGYMSASEKDVERALHLAASAFQTYSNLSGEQRAEFLRRIAKHLELLAPEILQRGELETALSAARLDTELKRTTGHLQMFANLIAEGSWVDARIDHGDLQRAPVPKPDLRSMLRPLGPVAVFCAANFPLAYSVAGGDSAAALAAGCPVIVIAHDGHPGVAELVAHAITRAAQETGMPDGVFSLLYGGGKKVGTAVVKHPAIKAVGFTGSRAGGTALMEIAANRAQPIPVYAEMSSVNPIVILPGALARGEAALAEAFFTSLSQGVGQFCTNPGLVFLLTDCGEGFLARLTELVESSEAGTMLNSGIHGSFVEATRRVAETKGVELLAQSKAVVGKDQAAPMVFSVPIEVFQREPSLQHEMFGPATLIVRGSLQEIEATIPNLEGQLTATLHATDQELRDHPTLIFSLREKCGRLIHNGFPTGVEVCDATVHGGPFPATTDGRSTSVGTMAIYRFCRPVVWQGFPQPALPPELQDGNPLGIRRMENR